MFWILAILVLTSPVISRREKCDQTPVNAENSEPRENKDLYALSIETKDKTRTYLPDQTYVLTLRAKKTERPFRYFMITAENPEIDNTTDYAMTPEDDFVGSLKTLDTDRGAKSRYSERCANSVENTDKSDKSNIEVHWISPPQSSKVQKVRIRAMVAENAEAWYSGDDDEQLHIILSKNENKPLDSPPVEAREECNLCSEARYQVVFSGKWSRLTHPRHYPTKPDDNGYSHMIGASHTYGYSLWTQGTRASEGIIRLVTGLSDASVLQQFIVSNISETEGTRTLIRGSRRHHPNMQDPSSALFRVDRYHHLFSLVVGMKPSPDWFLGVSNFELCTDDGWIDYAEVPLYPWDAGVADGISYEDVPSVTNPQGNIERVAVGSFDRRSPFYQLNLNDLKKFATLSVRKLDVYPLVGASCSEEGTPENRTEEIEIIEGDIPKVSEYRTDRDHCQVEWGAWSECQPFGGGCGVGRRIRKRVPRSEEYKYQRDGYKNPEYLELRAVDDDRCPGTEDAESEECYVYCN